MPESAGRTPAEEALQRSEARYQLLVRATNDAIWEWDLVSDRVWWNEGMQRLFGYPAGEVAPSLEAWAERIHEDDRARVLACIRGAVTRSDRYWTDEYRFRRAEGTFAHVLGRGYVVEDAEGRPVRMIGALTDITERKQLEEQLLQAQKMEAMGRLAGGIAHDFNNVLTAITGFTDFLLEDLGPGDARREDVEQIKAAADRGAALVRQLLTFGRRQVIRPRVVDLNAVIASAERLLRRVIGEDVELTTRLQPGLGAVRADPGQLEQVIMNLAVNARDAMPRGGRLTLETANVELDEDYARTHPDVEPGPYVLLAASDTGHGIAPEILPRIFEPFFTTKEAGRGTGLGLATVYGIVKQAGGHVRVESAPGQGTTFEVYLPRVGEGARADAGQAGGNGAPRGTETVLVVEDEATVRDVVRRGLESYGYTVLVAETGRDAISLCRDRARAIDLVIADVVLPDTTGPEMGGLLRRERPDLPVLYISGYGEEAAAQAGSPVPGASFLEKPFTPAVLARKVREVLEAGVPG